MKADSDLYPVNALARPIDGLSIVPPNEDEILVDYAAPVSDFRDMFEKFDILDADFPPSGLAQSAMRTRPRLARLNAGYTTSQVVAKVHGMRHSAGDIRDTFSLLANAGFDWTKLRERPAESVIINILGSPVSKEGLLFYPVVRIDHGEGGSEKMLVQLVLDGGRLQWFKGNYITVVEPALPKVSATTLSQS
ncbi:hypothetical protein M1432_03130 [Patescibacteria group bacterium]|nr:hypothetical protein [Patescibacteria group bacterium]